MATSKKAGSSPDMGGDAAQQNSQQGAEDLTTSATQSDQQAQQTNKPVIDWVPFSTFDFNSRSFPLTLKAKNNTPIPLYLPTVGASLASNYHTPLNECEVTFISLDHVLQETANVQAVESVHDFKDALLVAA